MHDSVVNVAFDVYRDDPDGDRSTTGDLERASGRPFIRFISLIIRIHIQNRLREHDEGVLRTEAKWDSANSISVDGVLQPLSTISTMGDTRTWRLTAMSKNVKETFKAFGLEPPVSGKVVLV